MRSILIVEDNEVIIKGLTYLLEKENFHVITVSYTHLDVYKRQNICIGEDANEKYYRNGFTELIEMFYL